MPASRLSAISISPVMSCTHSGSLPVFLGYLRRSSEMTCTCVSTIIVELLFVVPLGMFDARGCARQESPTLYQAIRACDVLAHNSTASRLRHRLDHFAQLLEVIPRMVGMRVVARPEKLVLAHKRHQPRDRPLVRISRNEALTLKIVRRFLAQLHRLTDSRAADDR